MSGPGMSRVEIACFVNREHAELAAEFLARHQIRASVPVNYFHRWVAHPNRVYVEAAKADRAAALLQKVAEGAYADQDPLTNSKGGLGAALAEAVLPAPGFRPLTKLQGFAPLIILVLAVTIGVVGRAVFHILNRAGA